MKRVAGDYDQTFYLSGDAKTEIQWWIDNINSQIRHIEHGKITFVLTTDASNQGWGAVFDALPSEGAQQCTGGRWTLEETIEHINGLELNPFRLSFSEPKCARGGPYYFLDSIFRTA